MQIVDQRLLRQTRPARTFLALAVVIGLAQTALLIAGAALLAAIIARAIAHQMGGLSPIGPLFLLLGLTFLGRAALAWSAEVIAHRASAAVKSQLRRRLLEHVVRLGSRWLTAARSGELATLTTRGIDALDGYFARYLPQVLLAVLLPLTICGYLLSTDWRSAVLILITLPVLVLALLLINRLNRRSSRRQWESLQTVAHHFLDVLAGLGTLAAFGRSKEQAGSIEGAMEQQRKAGRAAVRAGCLSSLVLELVTTLAIAGVVVVLGVRLVTGTLDLETALVVLILVPEAYLPIHRLAHRRADAAEGLGAADRVFAVLAETPPHHPADPWPADPWPADPQPADRTAGSVPDPGSVPIRLEGVTVLGGDERATPALQGHTIEIPPGRFTGIVAPSGAGKSTVLALLTGAARPDAGRVTVGGTDLADLDLSAWRSRIGWLSQDPALFAGTVASNIALGHPGADRTALQRAADAAAVDVALDHVVGERGGGLSTGQRRRVALARAMLGDPPLLLLDEPTESVDAETEAAIFDALRYGRSDRTVLVVTHRPALLQLCHHVVRLDEEAPEPVVAGPTTPTTPTARDASGASGASEGRRHEVEHELRRTPRPGTRTEIQEVSA